MAGAVDPVEFLGAAGLLERLDAHPGGHRFASDDHQQRARRDQVDEAEGVEEGEVVDAGPGEELRRARVLGAVGAVVLEALETVSAAQGAGLFGSVGEELEALDALAAGLGGTRGRGRGEHGLDDGGVLGAVGAQAELTGDGDGADSGVGPDAVVGGGSGKDIPAGGADAQRNDAVGLDLVAGGEERHRGRDVLDPVGRVLQATRCAFALALVGGTEREGDEALLGRTRSEAEVRQARVVVRATPQGPVVLPLELLDRQVVDTRMPGAHQALLVELPVLVPVGAEPVARVVVPLVGEADGDPVVRESSQLLDQPVVELSGPLPPQKRHDFVMPCRELRPVPPA